MAVAISFSTGLREYSSRLDDLCYFLKFIFNDLRTKVCVTHPEQFRDGLLVNLKLQSMANSNLTSSNPNYA